ncbi:MAG: MobC family plasmid mobilization relaxosome protein [Kamptonema sp. SIO1D9]|nr:MobC family plasmid mobilization relaxosome protein [Kamptonema sp. SIO1D9]
MPELEKKTKTIHLRYRPSELEHLDACAEAVGLTRSAYIRRKLQGLPVRPTLCPPVNWKTYKELGDLAAELRAIGNNINQIAKGINTANQLEKPIQYNLPEPKSLSELAEQINLTISLINSNRLEIIGVKETDEKG